MDSFSGSMALVFWFLSLFLGGYLIALSAFKLERGENLVVGLGIGMVVETVLAVLLSRVLSVPHSFYSAALLVLVAGIVMRWKDHERIDLFDRSQILPFIVFGVVTALMYFISRGMGIFDDYAHLPTTSLIAAGDVPPHFALNRSVPYAYHYFLLIFAGQMERVGGLFAWSALDLARSISFTLTLFLGACFTIRLTHNRYIGLAGGLFLALGSGTRWLLLMMPGQFLEKLSQTTTLIGSGASSGFTLGEALLSEWRIEGVGKLPIPFAFTNGIVQPGVLAFHGANGLMNLAILLLLLLTCNRWRGWRGAGVTAVLLSALSLVGEADLWLLLAGWGICAIGTIVSTRRFHLERGTWIWSATILAGVVLSAFEGGAFQDIVQGWLNPGQNGSYQSVGFTLIWPPTIVSAHLGILSLFQWRQLLAALFEIGPVLLVLPLMVIYGKQCWKEQRWFESIFVSGYLLTVFSILINFQGSTGVRNTSRLYYFLTAAMIYFVPLLWNWISQKTDGWKYTGAGLYLLSITGGFVLFAAQLPAIQTPVVAPFMSELDAKISQQYWNKLDKNAMVFDPVPYRSVIIFGRAVEAGETWYEYTPAWQALYDHPDPVAIHQAGYDYIYVDEDYWNSTTIPVQSSLKQGCVRQMESLKMWPGIVRKLFDISRCK